MNALLQFVARLFVILFFVGIVGSLVVVLISFIEDLELLVETDDAAEIDDAKSQA
jgi:hypothetical protein